MGLDQTLFWRDARLPSDLRPGVHFINGHVEARQAGVNDNRIRQWRKYWDFHHRLHKYASLHFGFGDGRDDFNDVCIHMGVDLLCRMINETAEDMKYGNPADSPGGTVCASAQDYSVTLEDTYKALKEALNRHLEGKHVYYYCSH